MFFCKTKNNNNCYVLMRCCLNWFSLYCLRMKYQNSVSFVKHVVSDILVLFHRTCETSKVGRLLWQEYNTWPNQEQDIANTTQQNFVIIWSFNIWCSSQTYTVHISLFLRTDEFYLLLPLKLTWSVIFGVEFLPK